MAKKNEESDDCPSLRERVRALEVKMNIIAAVSGITLAAVLATLFKVLASH